MRNLILIFTACFAMTLTASAQTRITGNKNYTTQSRNVEADFTSIKVNGSPDVYYTQSSGKTSIEIYGSSNIIPYIETFVEDGTLIVQYKRNTNINNPGKLEIRVSAPNVNNMSVNGSGDLYLLKGIDTSDLHLRVSGSGDIEGKDLKCNNLYLSVRGSGDINLSGIKSANVEAKVHGSGDIDLRGKAQNASYDVNGSGDISASKLEAENVEAHVNGSGDITCYATRNLTGKVRGSGDVGYKGNPEINFSRKGLYKIN